MSTALGLRWADRAFGSDADTLREVITRALAAACSQSQGAQDVSRARAKYPFGSSLWTLQFQELADGIALEMPDRHRLERLDNYSLAIVNGYVLYPVRAVSGMLAKARDAKVRKPVSKFRRQMFCALGPQPFQAGLWPEQHAEKAATDMRTLMTRLGPNARLAVISYVCEYKAGLTDMYWGEAKLNFRDGSLTFHEGEGLPVAPAANANFVQRGDLASARQSRAFDGGDLPEIALGVNAHHQPPVTEPEPSKPHTSDEEQ